MKNLILVFIAATLLFSCKNKETTDHKPGSSEKMTGAEFTAKYGIELSFLDYSTEEATAKSGGGNGNGKQKASSVTLSVSEDLTLSGSVSCTTSSNAEWGGIQKFLALPLSNDSAVSYCNFNWSGTTAPSSMNCPTTTSGVYRGWTSDKSTYDVHLSNTIIIN